MAAPTNSYQRSDVTNELEDISPLIYDTSPTECPLVQNAAKGTASNTTVDWTEDELDAADATNAWIDGDVFAASAVTPPVKLTNECQIVRKDFRISRRARKLAKTGQTDEVARQTVRKGRELKRDIEAVCMSNTAAVSDNGSVAPKTGSLLTWIKDLNSSGRTARGGSGADPVTTGSTAATDGTQRALDESGLLGVVAGIHVDSQEMPDALMLGTVAKQKFSNYMFSSSARIATQHQDQGKTPRGGVRVVGAVDVWVTDYAVVDVVPDRFQRERDAVFVNFDYVELAYFDPISTDAMAKDSDTDSRMVLADFALKVRNRYTLGVFADVDETTAMVA